MRVEQLCPSTRQLYPNSDPSWPMHGQFIWHSLGTACLCSFRYCFKVGRVDLSFFCFSRNESMSRFWPHCRGLKTISSDLTRGLSRSDIGSILILILIWHRSDFSQKNKYRIISDCISNLWYKRFNKTLHPAPALLPFMHRWLLLTPQRSRLRCWGWLSIWVISLDAAFLTLHKEK